MSASLASQPQVQLGPRLAQLQWVLVELLLLALLMKQRADPVAPSRRPQCVDIVSNLHWCHTAGPKAVA